MSLTMQPNCKLRGWEGPFYPALVLDLARKWSTPHSFHSGSDIDALFAKLSGYQGLVRRAAEDGYVWFWLADFYVGRGQHMLVAFPWAQDSSMGDGVALDRAPAVYLSKRSIGDRKVEIVLRSMIGALG